MCTETPFPCARQRSLMWLPVLQLRHGRRSCDAAPELSAVDGSDPPFGDASIGIGEGAHVHAHANLRRGSLPSIDPLAGRLSTAAGARRINGPVRPPGLGSRRPGTRLGVRRQVRDAPFLVTGPCLPDTLPGEERSRLIEPSTSGHGNGGAAKNAAGQVSAASVGIHLTWILPFEDDHPRAPVRSTRVHDQPAAAILRGPCPEAGVYDPARTRENLSHRAAEV